jgi:hypothetical protein
VLEYSIRWKNEKKEEKILKDGKGGEESNTRTSVRKMQQ